MIRRHAAKGERRGTILPMVAIGLIALFGFIALAVDVGMLAVARTQCQNAADAAAMAGARTLTGDASTDNAAATAVLNAVDAATTNSVLSQPLTAAEVTVQVGSYAYDPVNKSFPSPPFQNLVTVAPGSSPGQNPTDSWSLVQATVNYQGQYAFGKIFGLSSFN